MELALLKNKQTSKTIKTPPPSLKSLYTSVNQTILEVEMGELKVKIIFP